MAPRLNSAGIEVTQPQSPSLLRQARSLELARVNKTNQGEAVQAPKGWHFVTKGKRILLRPPPQRAHPGAEEFTVSFRHQLLGVPYERDHPPFAQRGAQTAVLF